MQKLSSRRGKKAGFTLLEVVFAAFVLTFAIGSSLIVITRCLAAADSARCISYASQIMQSELEKMRLEAWGDGTTAGTGTTGITSYPTIPTTINIGSGFYGAGGFSSPPTIKRTAADVHTGMIKITFVITWTTFDRRTLSRSYITYYGKNGLYDFFVA